MATLMPRVLRALEQFHATPPLGPQRPLPPQILRRLPRRFDSALDVGSGSGDLARLLASRAGAVHGIDVDPTIVARARELTAPAAPVTFTVGDLLTDMPPGPWPLRRHHVCRHRPSPAVQRGPRALPTAPGARRNPGRRRSLPSAVPDRPADRRRRRSVECRHGTDQEQGPRVTAPDIDDRPDPAGDHDLRGHRARRPPRAARRAAAPATVLALHARLAPALSSRRATVRPRNLMEPPGVRIRRVRPGVVAPTGYRASGACGTMPG